MMPTVPAAGLPPPVDEANGLLAPADAALLTAVNGNLGVITVRTATTTLTVQLPKAQVLAWANLIRELGEGMETGSSLLIATPRNTLFRPGQ